MKESDDIRSSVIMILYCRLAMARDLYYLVIIQIVTCCIVQLETQGCLIIAIINMFHGRFLTTTIHLITNSHLAHLFGTA